jgi:molecular chaperone DnaJ
MAAKRDYYEVLGVDKGATPDQIKQAYRKLALQHHPDRNKDPGATERFKEISEAYAVLSDEKKKAQYDQYGHAGFDQMYSQEDIFRSADFSDMEDVFRSFGFGADPFGIFGSAFGQGFGGMRHGGRRREYGADLATEVEITLEEAAKGVKKEFGYHRSRACKKCGGSGSEPGTQRKTCSACDGRGQVQTTRRMGPMQFYSVNTCARCHGEGKVVEKPCRACGGAGKVSEYEHINVNVPAGMQNGMRLRLEALGEYGRDSPGDLFVTVHIRKHERFERQGDDLWTEVPMTFAKATLGGEIEVPTLFGKDKLHIPAGTASHTVFRLRGEGMPRMGRGSGKGDLMVRAIIEVPKKLSKKQKELLEEFDKEGEKKGSWLGVF